VYFNGTTVTPTIRGSGNVTSVTKNGTGDYTVNFTTALVDTNYAVIVGNIIGTPADTGNSYSAGFPAGPSGTRTTTAVAVLTRTNNTPADQFPINVTIFR
jgi:hypothetical protein